MKTKNEFAQVDLKEYMLLKIEFKAMKKAIEEDLIVVNYNTSKAFFGFTTNTKYKRRDEVICELMDKIEELERRNDETLIVKNITINENIKLRKKKWYQFIKI